MKRVPPSKRTRMKIQEVLREGESQEDPLSVLMRLGMQQLIEEALEAKVRDLLGREYYERREGTAGSRNGYRRGRLKSSEGEVGYAVPQLRDIDSSALAELRARLSGRTEGLESLVLEMYARGCSTRDVEAIFRREDGTSLISRTAVSELCESLWEEYESFATRDLSDMNPLYLFIDGIHERLRPGSKAEAVLCAWALTWEGRKILIHLEPGLKESTDCCRAFLQGLKRRGLADPVLVVTDGASGLIRAVQECFATSLRQRCLAHKMRNLVGKLPEELRSEVKYAARAVYRAPNPEIAQTLREDFVRRYAQALPTAVRCFEEDFDACIAYLHCPRLHHPVIRTTNLLERLFREERRRTRAVGTFFGERPVLKLMFAALIRASESWKGIRLDAFTTSQLKKLQQRIYEQHRRDNAPIARLDRDSDPGAFYSKTGT